MSARDKKILIGFVGVLVLILAFFFGHRPLTEKKQVLQAENATLRDQYADLSMKAANADMYNREIKVMNSNMEEIYLHYPSYLQVENEIMDAVTLEKITESYISSLTISEPVAVEVTSESSAEQTENPEESTAYSSPYQLYDISTSISFESGYKELKNMIDLLATDSRRKSIGTLSATFDNSTGIIQGSMTYDTYFVYGLEKDYVEPVIPEMRHGVENIFGTIEKQ